MRKEKILTHDKELQSYVVGLALGDGNLSNPNKRAIRLRITCDNKYPNLVQEIQKSINNLLPNNKVSVVQRKNCVDVSCYSNKWSGILGWDVGSKSKQNVRIPFWIRNNIVYGKSCLRGLFQTDGSVYFDRGYLMCNFTSSILSLTRDVQMILKNIGYPVIVRKVVFKDKTKYVIRVSKDVNTFLKVINFWKN